MGREEEGRGGEGRVGREEEGREGGGEELHTCSCKI